MTKASIVQRLLDEKQITAEEAVILLQDNSFPIIPHNPYYPNDWTWRPNQPGQPYWQVTCSADVSGDKQINS